MGSQFAADRIVPSLLRCLGWRPNHVPFSPKERRHFRLPEPDDPVYPRERACIEASRLATKEAGSDIRPTFAPRRTLRNPFPARQYAPYLIPKDRCITWLWHQYKPKAPYDERKAVLQHWVEVLYGAGVPAAIGFENFFDYVTDGQASSNRAFRAAGARCVLFSDPDKDVADHLSRVLPRYDRIGNG